MNYIYSVLKCFFGFLSVCSLNLCVPVSCNSVHRSYWLSIHPHPFFLPSLPYALPCSPVYLTFIFFNSLFLVFNSCLLGLISPTPPPLLFPPVFHMSAACLFSLHLSPFSITPSPLLIPLADPQREPREWVGLKRERSAVLYPARSSLARLKRSEEEEKKNNHIHTTHGRGELFPLSPFLFPSPLYSSLPSLLSCLISHFYSPSAGARI